MNKTLRRSVLVLMVLMMSGVAFASSNQEKPTLEGLDADKNGYVSKAEASGSEAVAKLFDGADANKDMQLDKHEFETITNMLGKKKNS